MAADDQLCVDYTPPSRPCDFLVLGTPRSGTSLLAGLLSCHSRINMGFEQFSEVLRYYPGPRTARLQLYKCLCDGAAALDRTHPHNLAGNKITLDLFRHGGSLHDAHADVFHELPMRIVFVVRDGRANVWSRLMHQDTHDADAACDRWNFGAELILRRPLDCTCLVRFEDLIRQPQSILERLCEFLDIEYESAMLNTLSPLIPSGMRKPTFDVTKLCIPELPEGIERIRDNLVRLGYLK